MGYASDTFADITRKQYADWQARYLPKLQGLMDLSTNGQLMNNQLARADATQQQALNTATVGAANQQARYGATQQTNQSDNSLGLKSALATAGAKNGIRDAETDRQMSILTGGSTGLRELLNIGSET
ncbi:hypothetical protein M9782_13805 [Pectobacterium actinidiae]|uniref:hypothetical protein n=1 Tax=Pectobacterium TaxID=122277 RepID=UPI0020804BE2|nr:MULTISPECIES: hypothetical protein [Pectobacterium]WEF10292.1 hypothetical protein M9782_13805 [Pectobacterium actinidiae]GKV88527.1 hypothetical protein PEC301619_05090 [Pectobacterium carotovorum subsp. carotovorum]